MIGIMSKILHTIVYGISLCLCIRRSPVLEYLTNAIPWQNIKLRYSEQKQRQVVCSDHCPHFGFNKSRKYFQYIKMKLLSINNNNSVYISFSIPPFQQTFPLQFRFVFWGSAFVLVHISNKFIFAQVIRCQQDQEC